MYSQQQCSSKMWTALFQAFYSSAVSLFFLFVFFFFPSWYIFTHPRFCFFLQLTLGSSVLVKSYSENVQFSNCTVQNNITGTNHFRYIVFMLILNCHCQCYATMSLSKFIWICYSNLLNSTTFKLFTFCFSPHTQTAVVKSRLLKIWTMPSIRKKLFSFTA